MKGLNEYLPMNKKKKAYIILKYNMINKTKNLEIFSDEFFKKSKKLCKIIINNKKYDFINKLNLENFVENDNLKLKLIIIDRLVSFKKCLVTVNH